MVSKKTRRNESEGEIEEKNGGVVAEYEQSREQRIKENLERMQKLGILDLSRNLKPNKTLNSKPKTIRTQKPPLSSPRRSTRSTYYIHCSFFLIIYICM